MNRGWLSAVKRALAASKGGPGAPGNAPLQAMQEQLILSQKADTTGILVGGICHDFNNALAVIAGGAAYLSLQGMPGELQDTAATILKAAERCQDLVRQLLGFARKDQEPRKVRQSLNGLVQEAASLLAHVQAREVRLETDLAPEALEVRVDPGQLVQVLLNLGINALDALAGAGTLRLRTGRHPVGAEESVLLDCPQGTYVFVEVEDTGAGIPQELLDRIFEPFFTTRPMDLHTGLGLTMAQAIIKDHDGLIQCRSTVGGGTTFLLLLPEARGGSDEPLPAAPGRKLRVLLVEDSEPDAILILEALREGGFEPRARRVETAEAMARALAEETWDLILSDHNMPQFNGFSALALARKEAPGLAFLFVAGARGETLGERAHKAGAQGFVPKHRLDRLCSAVEQALHPGPEAGVPPREAPGLPQPPPGAPARITTVLLVDDDAAFLTIWARILRHIFKVQVLEARDGNEAVEVYRHHQDAIALAILDCNLPGLSGPEAFAAIRRLDSGARGILCSAEPEEALREHVREQRFLGYIRKPFSMLELQAVLRRWDIVP